MPDLDTGVVTSADGTPVEYLSAGHGPPVIAVPGALAMASDLAAFAALVAGKHTVHVVQRRGRGGSGPQGDRYGIDRECEDIEAVRARTGARLIFGHSFGGLAALRAACGSTAFDAVAVYEPGISVDGSIPADWIGRARREVAAGADFDAFVTFARGVNPDQTGRVPRWLLRLMLRRVIPRAELRQNLALMPQAIREHAEVGRLDGRLADYREVSAATLLMNGKGLGAGRQAIALARLAETIPRAETMTFAHLDHFGPTTKPGEIAAAVLRFFDAHGRAGANGTDYRDAGGPEPSPGALNPVARNEYAEYYVEHDAGHGEVVSVPHVLLALLSEGPKYGLQLREEFEAGTGEVWPLNVGQVYKTLGRLERDGLAESDDTGQEGPQKRFRITAGGRDALAAWLRTPPDLTSPPRDELVMKVLVAARVPGTDAHEVIQAHRVYLLELMQQWTRLKEGEARDDLSLALVVDSELFRLDAVIRWLDAAEMRLARAATAPAPPASAPVPGPQLRRLGARR